MATVYNTTFKLRRGLKEVWEKNNPILAQGEPGFELDTYRLKIGDGISNWNNLPYVANGEISVSTDGLSIILNEKNEISLAGFDEANLG